MLELQVDTTKTQAQYLNDAFCADTKNVLRLNVVHSAGGDNNI